jgi:hypothetical protein
MLEKELLCGQKNLLGVCEFSRKTKKLYHVSAKNISRYYHVISRYDKMVLTTNNSLGISR